MRLASLRAFAAAVEEGSLRAAARRLGISQPALTKMIRELERELSTALLSRSTSGVAPTAPGRVLYEHSAAAERELSHAVEEIEQIGGRMNGSLTIGATPLAVMLLVPETLRTFAHEWPEIDTRIVEDVSIEDLRSLRKGEFQVAIGPIPEHLPAGEYVVQTLMPVALAIVARKGHPLARARRLADLAQVRWVYTGTSPASCPAKALHERHGLQPPPPGALVNSTLALISIVAGSNHLGLLPYPMAAHPLAASHLEIVAVDERPPEFSLGALARADAALKPGVRRFLSHLHRAAHHLANGRGS